MRKRIIAALAFCALVVVGVAATPPVSAVTTRTTVQPSYVFIWMENKETGSITSAAAPYMTSFANGGRNFSNYYGVSHPSLPNYLAFASGSTQGKSGTDSISAGEISASNVWSQLSAKGISWRVYMESMPSTCYSGSTSGSYALKHNPATPFHNIFTTKKCNKVQPLTSMSPTNLPRVTFIAPNLCNDMHDCSVQTGDNWLKSHVPPLLNAGATVIITFDEGSTSTNGGGHIWTALDGPGIAPSVNSTTFNHYSALRAIEDKFGLTHLGGAASVNALPIG